VASAKRIQLAFGKAVRKRREAAGMSQERLADLARIHRSYIGDVERGERNIGLVNVYRIARALNVTVSELTADMDGASLG
jgi:transcriptional regulator with XRE-family HTH domain